MPETPSWINAAVLAKEIRSLRKRLCMLESVAKAYGIEVDVEEAPAPPKPKQSAPKRARPSKRQPRGAIRDGVIEILSESKKPMHAKDLLAALKARNITVGGKDPLKGLSHSLTSGKQFVNVGQNTWELK